MPDYGEKIDYTGLKSLGGNSSGFPGMSLKDSYMSAQMPAPKGDYSMMKTGPDVTDHSLVMSGMAPISSHDVITSSNHLQNLMTSASMMTSPSLVSHVTHQSSYSLAPLPSPPKPEAVGMGEYAESDMVVQQQQVQQQQQQQQQQVQQGMHSVPVAS